MNSLTHNEGPILLDYYSKAPRLGYGHEVNEQFLVHTQIGSGGQARIFSATDINSGESVALKVPSIDGEEVLARFIRETEVTQALSNESSDIVPFLDAGISNDYDHPFIFMAMKNMVGESFDKKIEAVGPGELAVAEVIQAVTPAFRGVAVAHEAELLHRDIKASNIFLDAGGNGKIGDFGIVSAESYEPDIFELYNISPDLMSDSFTATDTVMGTPGNLAPEVYLWKTLHTKAADAFAGGIALHYGLTGLHPLLSKRSESFYDQMNNYHPPRMSEYRKDVPKEVGQLTISLMEGNPCNRATVSDAVEILEQTAANYR